VEISLKDRLLRRRIKATFGRRRLQLFLVRMCTWRCLVTETFEVATVAAVAAASPAVDDPDRLFTLSPSRWPDLDQDCAAFLRTALRHASGDQCRAVVIGNIEQMESAIRNIKVRVAMPVSR